MISRSRAGLSDSRESRDASGAVQSGIFGPGNQPNGVHELAPVVALRREHAASLGGQAIKAPPPLARLLDPLAGEPAALFEPIQQRIQRGDLEFQPAA